MGQIMKDFCKQESGGVLILTGAGMLMLVIAFAGSIDLSRYLVARTQAQSALDNALLSAASVKAEQPVRATTRKFFRANFQNDFVTRSAVRVQRSNGGNTLTADVTITVPSAFGGLAGYENFRFNVESEVNLAIGNANRGAEIVMAIDVSASMCRPDCAKLNAMKEAAVRLVNQVLDDSPAGVYLGVVPFNHQVRMNRSKPTVLGPSVQHDGGQTNMSNVMALTNDRNRLVNHINGMNIDTNGRYAFTRTNVGTSVAGLMLLPDAQSRSYFHHDAGVPRNFDPANIDKVLVLMTDGNNEVNEVGHPRGQNDTLFEPSEPDNQHQRDLCTYFKDSSRNITIYSVVYDVASGPVRDIFRNCATGPQFFYDVSDSDALFAAYGAIASSIRNVRLSR